MRRTGRRRLLGSNAVKAEPTPWATVPREVTKGLLVAGTVISDQTFTPTIRVVNISEVPIRLKGGELLADLEPVCDVHPIEVFESTETEASVTPQHIKSMLSSVDDSVPDDIKERLEWILNKCSAATSSGPTDMG